MGQDTKIQWANHTMNPWRGCTKVSEGCKFCYAETQSKRNLKVLGEWGPNGTRVVASEAMWKEPLKWDKAAKEAGERHRVFCASMADVFEDWQGPMVDANGNQLEEIRGYENDLLYTKARMLNMQDVRRRLFNLIDSTPNLDWLLLTKRPENIQRMMPIYGDDFRISDATGSLHQPRPNVWLGTSVENQEQADKRIPELLKVPAKIRFLSCEPLLGPIDFNFDGDFSDWQCKVCKSRNLDCEYKIYQDDMSTYRCFDCDHIGEIGEDPAWTALINLVIVGGESGPNASPCNIQWIRSIVKQCKDAGVPVFVKQVGSKPYESAGNGTAVRSWGDAEIQVNGEFVQIHLNDPKGGDPLEWHEELRVRELPN